MRGIAAVVIGLAFLAAMPGTCPCPATVAASRDGQGCCAPETGLRAPEHECCRGETVAPRVATGSAPVSMPFLLADGPLPAAVTTTHLLAPRIVSLVAPSPPFVLRI